jgi:diguanylate cyclase (GGDEF)-like protein
MSEAEEKQAVLVVDDEESLRLVISGVLEDEGFQVTTAASAEEALEIFRATPFKLVISDIVMPGMNGIELLKEIKKIRPESEVIIITSQASMETAINAVSAGAYDYMIKPFEDLEAIAGVATHAFEKISLVEENVGLVSELKEKNTELKGAVNTLEDLANHDSLTGLHNHRCFQEALSMELNRDVRYHREFSLLFMDVDYFKVYNDTHGHPAGDELLKSFAALVKELLRQSDFFARYGGEEFIAILPETSKDGAAMVAESIRDIVDNHPFPGQDKQPEGNLTISLGVSTFPEDGGSPKTLISKADKALYRAKHTGRNKVCICDRE